MSAERPEYPTALGASSRDSITLLGTDLARDVMGEVGFGELRADRPSSSGVVSKRRTSSPCSSRPGGGRR